MKNKIVLHTFLLLGFFANAQYCDHPDLFIEQSSFGIWDYTTYGNGCLNPGNSDSCNIYIFKPTDVLIDEIPLRPAIIGVHGLCELGEIWDPFCDQLTAYLFTGRLHDAYLKYGFVIASVQYKQWVDEFEIADPCLTPAEEFARAHYRAVVDVRKAVKKLYDNAAAFSIDKDNIFLYGNSQGGMAVLQAALLTDEAEFFNSLPEFSYLQNEYGPIPERVPIKGVINLSGFVYAKEFIDESDSIPLFLAHGTCDEIIPYQSGVPFFCTDNDFIEVHGSLSIATEAHRNGIPYSLHTINQMGHGWTNEMQELIAGSVLRSWIKDQVICGTPQNEQFFYDAADEDCPPNNLSPEDILTSTGAHLTDEDIRVFPTLFTQNITIESLSCKSCQADLSIFDLNGKSVYAQRSRLGQSIDLSWLEKGVYIILIKPEGQRWVSRAKIVKWDFKN